MLIRRFSILSARSFGVLLATWLCLAPLAQAQDLSGAEKVVNDYLTALVNGDAAQLGTLIDGRLKARSPQLTSSPDTYSQFLRTHYAGVRTTLESVVPDGDKARARVRFDYPTQQSSVIEFILRPVDGQWKITDEVY